LMVGLPLNGRLRLPAQVIDGRRRFPAKFGFGSSLTVAEEPSVLRRPLTVRADRLDRRGTVPPVRVNPVYGFVGPIRLDFPSPGCWRVLARVGRFKMTMTLRVVRA